MILREMPYEEIARCIERDPDSWKGISFLYLKLSQGTPARELESVIAKTAGNMLALRGRHNDYVLLGTKPEVMDYPGKDMLCCIRISDILLEWQQVCNIIHGAIARADSRDGRQKTGHTSHSILIVEDEPMTSRMMAHQLKNFGTVITTSNPREAKANYMVHHPDLVFLDVHYANENSDGFDVLKSIMSAENDAFIVMVSGDRSATKILQALQLGAQGFIAKPFLETDFPHYLAKFDRLRRKR